MFAIICKRDSKNCNHEGPILPIGPLMLQSALINIYSFLVEPWEEASWPMILSTNSIFWLSPIRHFGQYDLVTVHLPARAMVMSWDI